MSGRIRSYLHVIIQFSAIFYFVIEFSWIDNSIFRGLIFFGLALATWSIWEMRKSGLTAMPDPQPQIRLIKSGPYKLIRHPMYTSLFIVLIPIVVFNFSIASLIVLIVFSINQLLKIKFEEKLLCDKISEYRIYMKKTWRLIPWLL